MQLLLQCETFGGASAANIARSEGGTARALFSIYAPIMRSVDPFCQGERNEVGRFRMPIARTEP